MSRARQAVAGGGAATSINPGVPIGNVTPGTGEFTTLSTTQRATLAGNYGSQVHIGSIGQAGRIDFAGGVDGVPRAYIGFNGAGISSQFSIESTVASSIFRVRLADSLSAMSTAIFVSGEAGGRMSIGNIGTPSARLHIQSGNSFASGAPLKINSGALLSVTEAGAEEFLNNDRFYTGTDGARRRYAVNGNVITLQGFTVATLPASPVGSTAFVTDALSPAYGAAVVGGGAVTVAVFRNATTWICA